MDDEKLSLTQLRRIKKEKDALAVTMDDVEKARAKAEVKLEASLKLQHEVDVELLKAKDANSDLRKQLDAASIKCDQLAGELIVTNAERDVALNKALCWDINCEV